MRMIIGPDLDSLRQQAETAIDAAYGAPLGGHAFKVAEARRVLARQKSPLLAEEAALRGVSVKSLAQKVLDNHEAAAGIELRRIRIKLELRAAQDEAAIRAVLKTHGISLPEHTGARYGA